MEEPSGKVDLSQNASSPGHSGRDASHKWWHVPDNQIEDMIAKLGGPHRAKPNAASAGRRTVRFSSDAVEDALDREMRKTMTDAGTRIQRSPASKRKNWQVSDEQIHDFIQRTSKANAEELTSGRSLAHAGKVMSRNCDAKPGIHCTRTLGNGEKRLGAPSIRSRDYAKQTQAMRPAWNTTSAPSLFAHVGSGLDGKGNKILKPEAAPFETMPIYLSDAHSAPLIRVRQAVAGHCTYTKF